MLLAWRTYCSSYRCRFAGLTVGKNGMLCCVPARPCAHVWFSGTGRWAKGDVTGMVGGRVFHRRRLRGLWLNSRTRSMTRACKTRAGWSVDGTLHVRASTTTKLVRGIEVHNSPETCRLFNFHAGLQRNISLDAMAAIGAPLLLSPSHRQSHHHRDYQHHHRGAELDNS